MGGEQYYPANLIISELKKLTTLVEKILELQVTNKKIDSIDCQYITISESENILKVSRSTINRYLKTNTLLGKKVHGRVLIYKRSVDDLLDKSKFLSKKGGAL